MLAPRPLEGFAKRLSFLAPTVCIAATIEGKHQHRSVAINDICLPSILIILAGNA